MKAKWLDRSLMISPLYFTLCTSERILKTELKRMGVDSFKGVLGNADASTHFLFSANGQNAAIVCLFNFEKIPLELVYGLLVHEAAHVWQEIKELTGEGTPGKEQEAYSLQAISQQLFLEFNRQTKNKRRRNVKST